VFIGGGSAQVGLAVGTVHDWEPDPGSVVSWQPSPASLAKARQAPISPVPIAYMQAGHLRGHCEFADRGLDYSRIVMGSWDVPGRCDIRTMTYVINAHLRRHETYHSWFDYKDAKNIFRHTIANPRDIEFVPTEHGQMTPTEWRELVLATPDPLQWDCFRFGIIQHADHFALFVIVDHLHTDPALITGLYVEILAMYRALVSGAAPISLPPTASHDDFCVRESQYAAAVSLDSPEVRKWIEFAENNGGTLPEWPLPLGDISPTPDLMSAQLLDERQTAGFESACIAAGARFSGGVFACAALAQYELTGADTYYGLASADTRSTPADFMTMGLFRGDVPITVPITASSFGDTTRAAQASFDSGKDLANVPFDRVLALAPWLRAPQRSFPMQFYFDVGCPPLSGLFSSQSDRSNVRIYRLIGFGGDLHIRVFRLEKETQVIVQFPDNPVARDSITRYITALKSVYARVADAHGAPSAQGTGVVRW
jgi:hypothetical protein